MLYGENTDVLEKKIKLQHEKVDAFLQSLGINYEFINHFPATNCDSLVDNYKEYGFIGGHCKNLFVTDGNHFFLIIIEKDKKVDLKSLKGRFQNDKMWAGKLFFANNMQIEDYLGVKPGALSLFNLLNSKNKLHLRLIFDESLLAYEKLAFHPNDNTKTYFISTKDISKILAAFMELLQPSGWHYYLIDVPSKQNSIEEEKTFVKEIKR